jgi:hypothetical protein
MALISIRLATPLAGKAALSAERAHTLGGIYARHGAKARVGRVIACAGAGQIYLGIGWIADGLVSDNADGWRTFASDLICPRDARRAPGPQ